ncbi:response regulator [Phenylobacterium sp.]|uniref:response regulator n=1 Tax=Phenylobacterium sp. TaxID=1871053 RepID=UPI0027358141|nr:response regulator [Phenylobacterium sp.]MDP3661171.1 response regulator [Phenylobacterium sp.]
MKRTVQPRRGAKVQAGVAAGQLAALSHEFRTPLNGVLGMARLLEGTRLTAEQRAYVAALRESGEHLLGLVNDLLDFAKLGEGKVELHPASVDVEALLRQVCELLSPRAREKGLEIAWAVPPAAGRILADEGRVRQILLNFAGNAVKFTEAGGVLVTAERTVQGATRFIVADTGPGVPVAARDRVFEAYAQADPHAASLGGAGLGLAIARRLAHAMDGEVGVESPAGGGATFWFEARFDVVPDSENDATLTGRVVGVASPSAIVREGARRQIEASDGRAVVADNLETLSRRAPKDAVLLVDHALAPAGRALRPPEGRAAVILLAPDERGRIARYREAGFRGYLIKPLRRASLAERVLAAIDGAATTGQPGEDERVVHAVATGARVLLVEDNPINAMLARTLLTREGCAVDHARSGEDALAALKQGRFDLILMDMRMPGLSGAETTRRLRADGVASPVVALTANAFDDDRRACLAAGMNDFLVKPLSPDALRGMLARWVKAGWTDSAERAKLG